MTGADSPVMAASLTEAMPSITSPSPGMMSPASHTPGRRLQIFGRNAFVDLVIVRHQNALGPRLGAGFAQSVGLRLAAAFRDSFGEIGEQHREPQPDHDLESKAEAA